MKPAYAILVCSSLLFVGCGIDLAMSAATAGHNSGQAAKTNLRRYSEADAKLAKIQLEQAIRSFQISYGRYPASLEELVPEILAELPRGFRFEYDPRSGRVTTIEPEAPVAPTD